MIKISKIKLAAYIRISKREKENNSIINQKDLINYYVSMNNDMEIYSYYIDDGYSGTDFNRPELKKMLKDISNNKVDAVIVKDLSRIGRNYIEVGELLDSILPLYDVKFISINDNIDEFNKNKDSYLLKGIINIYNENYPKDISEKLRTTLTIKKLKGEFIGAYAPYGYVKSPRNKHMLIIDNEAAKIVKLIFDGVENGKTRKDIVNTLNEKKIKTPMEHIKDIIENKNWNIDMINGILKNKVYTGDLIQHKRKRVSFKNHKFIKTQKNELIITENHHTAIINKGQFERVQKILNDNHSRRSKNGQDNILIPFLRCKECGNLLYLKRGKNKSYYYCSTYLKSNGCTKHSIVKEKLEEKVLLEIKKKQSDISKITKSILYKYVNYIYIYNDGKIKIDFKE